MAGIEHENATDGRFSRFSIADVLLATSLAAGPLGIVSLIGWKAAVCLTLMAVAMTIGRACKRIVFRVLLLSVALISGAAIAASAETMEGLLVSLGWMLVVVLTPIAWQARKAIPTQAR